MLIYSDDKGISSRMRQRIKLTCLPLALVMMLLLFQATIRITPMEIHRSTLRQRSPLFAWQVDGGEYFDFFRAGIRAALAPHEVVFSHRCDVCEQGGTPDIVMFSAFGSNHAKYEDVAKIMFVGEAWDWMKSLEALTTVHCLKNVSETQYFPFWVSSFGERRVHGPEDLIRNEKTDWDAILKSKKEFCAFMYSHQSEARDALFDLISQYKQVKGIGSWKHNDDSFEVDRGINNSTITYNDLAVEKYKTFKFAIAGENTVNFEGYITEKIVNVMLANTIPIYIGSPDIAEHFNPKSFINANEMSADDLMETIRYLDQNDTAFVEMLQEPWLIDNKLPDWFSLRNQSYLFRGLSDRIH